MQRSPIALFAVLFVALAASAVAQFNPATPKPGSGVPESPVPSTTAPQKPEPQPPPTATDAKPDSTAATPTPTPSAEKPIDAKPADAQPTDAEKPGTNDATKKSDTKAGPEPTPQPEPTQVNPKTDILDSSATSGALVTNGHDPILDPPAVPKTTTTLVGGIITGVDRMRNRLTVQVFGGGHWRVNFDERTHIFHNGAETTQLALKKGERVYVDTQLDTNRHDIFARNIRVGVTPPPADADGQVISVDLRHNEVMLRDVINSVPVRFAIDDQTRISHGQTPTVLKEILPGTLVHVRFAPERPNRGLAREIDIVARPGANFTFAGKVTYLDLHRGILAIQNSVDDKNYEIHFSPTSVQDRNNLGVGIDVRVVATFEGSRYTAQSVVITNRGPEAENR
jgi:outer membrane biosynthesis protein TonB